MLCDRDHIKGIKFRHSLTHLLWKYWTQTESYWSFIIGWQRDLFNKQKTIFLCSLRQIYLDVYSYSNNRKNIRTKSNALKSIRNSNLQMKSIELLCFNECNKQLDRLAQLEWSVEIIAKWKKNTHNSEHNF